MNYKSARKKLFPLAVAVALLAVTLQHMVSDAHASGVSQSTVVISLTKEPYCVFITTSLNVTLPTPNPFYLQDVIENASLEFFCTETGTLIDWQIGPGQWSQGSLHRMRLQDREFYLPYSIAFNPPPPSRTNTNPAEASRVRFTVMVKGADIAAAASGIFTDSVTFTLSY